ncbi:MAG: hypothetical protein HOQ05_08765 [Corynebacteriales bacterium]|nr:hypothetical protein [Mycobacteriales bacterium]
MIGKLETHLATTRPELLAAPVSKALQDLPGELSQHVEVAEIDPDLADTAAFCAHYDVPLAQSANCVIAAGTRAGVTSLAGVLVLATTRADINGTLRRLLGARKASFASMEQAVSESGMEYGGITPIGLPSSWPLFIDSRVVAAGQVVIGSGLRKSKIVVPAQALSLLPNTQVIDDLAR